MPLTAAKEFLFQETWPPPLHDPDIRDPTVPKIFYWWNIYEYLHTVR